MREIGSEFWNVPIMESGNSLFLDSTQWYLSGRCALKAILAEIKGEHTVAMPSWCCESMIKPFLEKGFKIRFYYPFCRSDTFQETIRDSDILLLMDYFGYSFPQHQHTGYAGVVIRDVTHSMFSTLSYMDADYYYGSLRKWCGVWTGGFAWTKDHHILTIEQHDDLGYSALRKKAMQLKESYIRGESDEKTGFLSAFEKAEERLDSVGIVPAMQRDVMLAERIDSAYIRTRRQANAKVLREAFRDWLIIRDMKETDCPMFVPVLVPDGRRDNLRRCLIENGIYFPVHWPKSKYHGVDPRMDDIYDNELSLVCDQRYTEEDMHYIVEMIKTCWKES